MSSAAEVSVRVEAVRKTYRSGDRSVDALGPLSFAIARGSSLAVVGPSGCGKSTLLRIVAGLDQPTAGAVLIGGKPVSKPVAGMGVVFQRDLLLDWRNVIDNVMLPAELQKRMLGQARQRARELLSELDIADFAERQPWELSGGMRQRAAIARALLCAPDLLLLDEPFSALDALTRDQMGVLLQRVQHSAGATTLLITHSIAEAVFLSDRVLVMSPRPGTVLDDIAVALPRPRLLGVREEPEFVAIARRIREQFERAGVLAA